MKRLHFFSLAIPLACTALRVVAAPTLPLWNSATPFPKAAELARLDGVHFHVIKRYEPAADGYRFLHGVALAWHRDRLYASIGHNQGGENTETEEARFTVSNDGGKTWSAVATMDAGLEPGIGISHGVFLGHGGNLWAFHGAYTGTMKQVHTRAYLLDDATGKWVPKGTVIEGGFWPLQEPVRMDDGNWIMAGFARIGQGNPAAVAISRSGDFLKWDLVVIPKAAEVDKMWGESTVVVTGKRVIDLARRDGAAPTALVAVSDDFGRTWTPSEPTNLPMAASKPYAGRLSTGQSYLVCSTTADGGNRRSPLTIAVSRPGETVFARIFLIRPALFPDGPGESHEKASLAYPYTIEHAGHLYVGYSNSGGGVGRVGTGRELWNNNSAEMAVIPISSLHVR
jgi:hypothetical protein